MEKDTLEVPMVEITAAEYNDLVNDSNKLRCLENAGVDNWDGIDEAIQMRREENEE